MEQPATGFHVASVHSILVSGILSILQQYDYTVIPLTS